MIGYKVVRKRGSYYTSALFTNTVYQVGVATTRLSDDHGPLTAFREEWMAKAFAIKLQSARRVDYPLYFAKCECMPIHKRDLDYLVGDQRYFETYQFAYDKDTLYCNVIVLVEEPVPITAFLYNK
jgi:hypothetical protein